VGGARLPRVPALARVEEAGLPQVGLDRRRDRRRRHHHHLVQRPRLQLRRPHRRAHRRRRRRQERSARDAVPVVDRRPGRARHPDRPHAVGRQAPLLRRAQPLAVDGSPAAGHRRPLLPRLRRRPWLLARPGLAREQGRRRRLHHRARRAAAPRPDLDPRAPRRAAGAQEPRGGDGAGPPGRGRPRRRLPAARGAAGRRGRRRRPDHLQGGRQPQGLRRLGRDGGRPHGRALERPVQPAVGRRRAEGQGRQRLRLRGPRARGLQPRGRLRGRRPTAAPVEARRRPSVAAPRRWFRPRRPLALLRDAADDRRVPAGRAAPGRKVVHRPRPRPLPGDGPKLVRRRARRPRRNHLPVRRHRGLGFRAAPGRAAGGHQPCRSRRPRCRTCASATP
jgi:hypothetical protein